MQVVGYYTRELHQQLDLDIIERQGAQYGGVFDAPLKRS